MGSKRYCVESEDKTRLSDATRNGFHAVRGDEEAEDWDKDLTDTKPRSGMSAFNCNQHVS